MKKRICILIAVLTLVFLAACGNEKNEVTTAGNPTDNLTADSAALQVQPTEEETKSQPAAAEPVQCTDGIDVDLTKLSSTMIYSEVYNMMVTPDKYIGKTVKMKGQFAYYEDPDTKVQYFACIIADATACCSQGLEFSLTGEHSYPDDYPELGSEITVTGIFELYEENGFQYCRLVNAALVN